MHLEELDILMPDLLTADLESMPRFFFYLKARERLAQSLLFLIYLEYWTHNESNYVFWWTRCTAEKRLCSKWLYVSWFMQSEQAELGR